MPIDFSGGKAWAPHNYRWCYVRGDRIETAFADERVLDALIALLKPPGKAAAIKPLSVAAKQKLVDEELGHLQEGSASPYKGRPRVEILAANLLRAKLPEDQRAALFAPVPKEADLASPVSKWLGTEGMTTQREIWLGTKVADLVGYRPSGVFRSELIWSVELKNDLSQLDRAFAQLATYRLYSTRIYFACTPELAATCLVRHVQAKEVQRWDALALEDKLKPLGCGLLLVEGDAVAVARDADVLEPDEARRKEVRAALKRVEGTAQAAAPSP